MQKPSTCNQYATYTLIMQSPYLNIQLYLKLSISEGWLQSTCKKVQLQTRHLLESQTKLLYTEFSYIVTQLHRRSLVKLNVSLSKFKTIILPVESLARLKVIHQRVQLGQSSARLKEFIYSQVKRHPAVNKPRV